MPMNRALYPPNWRKISIAIRLMANWTCQGCNRPCHIPGEPWDEFKEMMQAIAPVMVQGDRLLADLEKPRRFTLTVAHLDGNPENNRRENLRALCTVCHLRHDLGQHLQRRQERHREQERLKHIERGQLELF